MQSEDQNLNEAPENSARLRPDRRRRPGIRLVLRHRLEADGYRVEEAADSQSALDALTGNRHEVALLDIMMPGAGGLEVLTAARAQASHTPHHRHHSSEHDEQCDRGDEARGA